MFRYDITESKVAANAVDEVSSRIDLLQQDNSHEQARLQLVSMKENFDLELLTRFYNEIMIPNFPLEEERDDLEDWLYCLDPTKRSHTPGTNPYPNMDVLLLVKNESQSTNDIETKTTIVGGVAFEYYKQAQCGLLSYMVVPKEFRRLGVMKSLHPVACQAMQLLHQEHTKDTNNSIRAIVAETNTPDAGDVPPAVIRKRHEILYQLGYRHLKFPYIQPALAEDADSFDDIILLIYAPDDSNKSDDKAEEETTIETSILRDYIVDFFQSVTGYDSDKYKEDWYYQLVEWFTKENIRTEIAPGLPWEDITQTMKESMAKSTKRQNDQDKATQKNQNRVTVIGAGIAGLVSAVTLAEEYLKQKKSLDNDILPLTITLIEAQSFVGGRIRTVETRGTNTNENNPLVFSNDRLPPSRRVDGFEPWPVSIGAEFVHGVDSMANQLIEDHEEWLVHETFDLCGSSEFYPTRNSFLQRRSSISLTEEQRKSPHVEVFMDNNFCPMQGQENNENSENDSLETRNIRKLIRRANHIWQNLQSIGEELSESHGIENVVKHSRDMSLDAFVNDQLSNGEEEFTAEEIEKTKKLLESLYSNTAGSSNKHLGIYEASREEWNWEYTESNFRLEKCFNEFLQYYLDRITEINKQSKHFDLGITIDVEMSCPVSDVGSLEESDFPIQLSTKTGKAFDCDKCIVAVPLGVLKANKITFRDACRIPYEKQEAIDTINMFSGMKAHMLLKVGIDIEHISKRMKLTELLFCPGEIFSQVWLRRNEQGVFLSGFCVANCRDKLMQIVASRGDESKSDVAQDLMLNQVQRIFGSLNPNENTIFCNPSSPTCSSFALHDWSDDEFTLGIYSSPSVSAGWGGKSNSESLVGGDLPPTHRDILAKPINNQIWFAGEHVNVSTCATVQSAMESGAKAAKEAFMALA